MTVTPTGAQGTNPDNFCYRHPARRSFVLCQRCLRTICSECQTQAPVGVICPECIAEQRGHARAEQRMHATSRRRAAGGRVAQLRAQLLGTGSPVTYVLMALIVLGGVLQWLTRATGSSLLDMLGSYSPQFTDLQHHYPSGQVAFEPWRMLTTAFLHGSFLHLAMNTLTLWIFGRALEPLLGSVRFAVLFVVSVLGGSLAVAVLAPEATWVIGASGGIFGLFASWFLVLRKTGQDVTSMLVLIGINIAVSFIGSGISWQAHVGGLVFGLLAAGLTLFDLEQGRKKPGRVLRTGARKLPVFGLWLQVLLAALCVAIPPVLGTIAQG